MRYHPADIERKWQQYWEEHKTFATPARSGRPKYYVLDMFPYPSGRGLHVGHAKGYVATDVVARYKRMRGFDVLHPMGWDAFGLPAERQADKEGIHPAEVTERNIDTFRRQLKAVGFAYDWDREFSTTDPGYYKWTQWIFLKLIEMGLAYQAEVPVNWCPALGTVLANEEVQDGKYIETGDPVEKRMMRQWMLKITAYADRLVDDLDLLDWPESLKEMQRNWIGRTEGAEVRFEIAGHDRSFEVFTTRPDTLFGCTFCVLAPEHPLVDAITTEAQRAAVEDYRHRIAALSERERMTRTEKTGVWTGAEAVCPVNGKRVPIWIADYVLMGYGSGAVFGCPAHDERDWEFATKFGLEIIEVVAGGNVAEGAYVGDGSHVNSEFLDGLDRQDAFERIVAWLEGRGIGRRKIQYRLRDWLFSRQRYWGEPIPVVHTASGEVRPLPEGALPVLLPERLPEGPADPDDPAPLARARDWVVTTDPSTGEPARRETNTMPQWAGSSWYFLRFIDPNNDREPWSVELANRWMPVDLYVGGAEHATLHLLYARFWHKVFHDLGLVEAPEPFRKVFNQGMIQARSFRDERGKYYYPHEVEDRHGEWHLKQTGEALVTQIEKMSKSRYNVVSPEEVIAEYGADSLRLYEAFMGPVEDHVLWQTESIQGVYRFLDRVWRLIEREVEPAAGTAGETTGNGAAPEHASVDRLLHKTIRKVGEDIENLRLNTALAQLMIFVNEAMKLERTPVYMLEALVRLLAPFAPHIAEELWSRLGHAPSIAAAAWPEYDPAKCIDEEVTLVVQVNGKLRGRLQLERGASRDLALEKAREVDTVNAALGGKPIRKVIFVEDRLLNLVVGN
jgi:leucyl-tRNA synthetase